MCGADSNRRWTRFGSQGYWHGMRHVALLARAGVARDGYWHWTRCGSGGGKRRMGCGAVGGRREMRRGENRDRR